MRALAETKARSAAPNSPGRAVSPRRAAATETKKVEAPNVRESPRFKSKVVENHEPVNLDSTVAFPKTITNLLENVDTLYFLYLCSTPPYRTELLHRVAQSWLCFLPVVHSNHTACLLTCVYTHINYTHKVKYAPRLVGIHPNPGPVEPDPQPPPHADQPRSLSVAQLNIDGISAERMARLLSSEMSADLIFLQETKGARKDASFKDRGYSFYNKKRDGNNAHGGGVAILVRDDLRMVVTEVGYSPVEGDNTPEALVLDVKLGDLVLRLVSLYLPPELSFASASLNKFLPSDGRPVIICADANVHSSAIYTNTHLVSGADNARALQFVRWVADSNLSIQNDTDLHTCVSVSAHTTTYSAPDVTLTRGDIRVSNWRTEVTTTKHRIIRFNVCSNAIAGELSKPSSRERRKYAWSKVTNWKVIAGAIDGRITEYVCHLPLEKRVRRLAEICKKVANKHVPNGSRREGADPYCTTEIRSAESKAAVLRVEHEVNPSDESRERYQSAEGELRELVEKRRFELMEERINKIDPMVGSAWKYISSRHKPAPKSQSTTIEFTVKQADGENKTRTAGSNLTRAEGFNQFYARHSKACEKHRLLKPRTARTEYDQPIQNHEISAALSELRTGKASGGDEMYVEVMSRFGPKAKSLLFGIVKESLETGVVPHILRHAIIVPIAKPGKAGTAPGDYRPVSLTSAIAKLIEKVAVRRLLHLWSPCKHQFAYRAHHSTETALMRVVDWVYDCLNCNHIVEFKDKKGYDATRWARDRALAVFIDFSAAFDLIDHRILAKKMRSSVPSNMLTNWFERFLHNRKAQTRIESCLSGKRTVSVGVPQGTVSGPQLFLLYVDDLLRELTEKLPHIEPVMYADDLTLMIHGDTLEACKADAAKALEIVNNWSVVNKMRINASKSEALLFSTSTRTNTEKIPDCSIPLGEDSIKVHTVSRDSLCKLLGVTFDNRSSFTAHLRRISNNVKGRAAQLSSVCTVTAGPLPRMAKTFEIGYVESPAMYAAAIYSSVAHKTAINNLEVAQRVGLRAITGVLATSDVTSQYLEASSMPVGLLGKERYLIHWDKAMRDNPEWLQQPARYETWRLLCNTQTAPVKRRVVRHQGLRDVKNVLSETRFERTREPSLLRTTTKPWEALDDLLDCIHFDNAPTTRRTTTAEKSEYNEATLERLNAVPLKNLEVIHATLQDVAKFVNVIATDGSVVGLAKTGTAAAVVRSYLLKRFAADRGFDIDNSGTLEEIEREAEEQHNIHREFGIENDVGLPLGVVPLPSKYGDHLGDTSQISSYFCCTEGCGDLTCSYRAETTAIRLALRKLGALLNRAADHYDAHLEEPTNRTIVILTDSLAAIQALRAGPLLQTGHIEDDIWTELLKLARAGWKVRFGFVYSHCGTLMNDLVDGVASNTKRVRMHEVPFNRVDAKNAIKQHTKSTWTKNVRHNLDYRVSHRSQLVGTMPTKLDGLCPITEEILPRFVLCQLARFRTGESELFGPNYWGVRNQHNACRWCHPELHGGDLPPIPRPKTTRVAVLRKCNAVGCRQSPVYKTFAGFRDHLRVKHRFRVRSDDKLPCEYGCDETFASTTSRGVHYISCPIRKRLPNDYVIEFPPAADAPHLLLAAGMPLPNAPAPTTTSATATRPVPPPPATPANPPAPKPRRHPRPAVKYYCSECNAVSDDLQQVKLHFATTHAGRTFKHTCGYGCRDPHNADRPLAFVDYHERDHHTTWVCPIAFPPPAPDAFPRLPMNECLLCGKCFPNRPDRSNGARYLQKHHTKVHNPLRRDDLQQQFRCEFGCVENDGSRTTFASFRVRDTHYRRTQCCMRPPPQPTPPTPQPENTTDDEDNDPRETRDARKARHKITRRYVDATLDALRRSTANEEEREKNEFLEAVEAHRRATYKDLLETNPNAQIETVPHMLICPSATMTALRAKHDVERLFNEFGEQYFFSKPFFYWMMDCVGHSSDGMETYAHGAVVRKFAEEASLITPETYKDAKRSPPGAVYDPDDYYDADYDAEASLYNNNDGDDDNTFLYNDDDDDALLVVEEDGDYG